MDKKIICTGLLAHVDAGKTTLSEAILYLTQNIRALGRVDHQNSFLDYEVQERKRGITIYSKELRVQKDEQSLIFLDTPGHVDFGSEMQRCLPVLDYAILLISGIDGIQAHSETIWRLCRDENIPVFIFVNKMDLAYRNQQEIMQELKQKLDVNCINFRDSNYLEECASASEELIEHYLNEGDVPLHLIQQAIYERKIFPVYFGSALKLEGIEELLEGLFKYTNQLNYPSAFGARIYKISYDDQGKRWTHLKVTGGKLQAKMKINDLEKIDQIRHYQGNKYDLLQEVEAGDICAVSGLTSFQALDGLGFEQGTYVPATSAFMNYRLKLPDGVDPFMMMKKLKRLAEEDPSLELTYHEVKKEIRMQLMGEVQMEIIKQKIADLFHIEVGFDEGKIAYKESIIDSQEGVGHYEPLRHYSEVHIRLDPLPNGSGLQFDSEASLDVLERHWQRLILTHMKEKCHVGVLGGFPITDMKLTLVSGRAHSKHTEGGDFREATYRAIRQGLMKAQSVILEPYYHFHIEVSSNDFGKVYYDLQQMEALIEKNETIDDMMIIEGRASVKNLANYPLRLRSITKGKGRISCDAFFYEPIKHQDEFVQELGYDPLADLENPCGSVFCEHGSALYVEWDRVENHMHLPLANEIRNNSSYEVKQSKVDDAELKRVFESIYGKKKEKKKVVKSKVKETYVSKQVKILPKCLLVDGYNIIYDWNLMQDKDISSARDQLIHMMNSYQGLSGYEIIIVFDAYKVDGKKVTLEVNDNIHIVYTKQSQTADSYIEQATHKLSKDYQVIVATSDGLEQLIVISQGAIRISAREFFIEYEQAHQKAKTYLEKQEGNISGALAKLRNLYSENK